MAHAPTGWNTWDFRGFNRIAYLNRGRTELVVQVAIWDQTVPPPSPESRQIGRLYSSFRWTDVVRLGPHAPLGLPAELDFKAGETTYRLTASDHGGALEVEVAPLEETLQRIVFMFVAPVGEAVQALPGSPARFAGWELQCQGAACAGRYFLNIAEPYAVGEPGRPARLTARRTDLEHSAPGTLQAYAAACIQGGDALADAPQAMMQAVNWNTLFDTRRALVSSPVSRDWCYDWQGVLVFCWDTFFVGAMTDLESPELARFNFEAVTAAIDEIGHVPNYYMAHGAVSLDRSMPPLGAYMIRKTQAPKPDLDWLAGMYPRLVRWHGFWMKNRDGNGDGLLEWGSNAEPRYEFPQLLPYNPSLQHTAKCAMYESGLDNSPMYDDVRFNEQANTFELADVGLNSYYAMDCESLAWLAETLGKPQDAARFRQEFDAHKERMNALLWDEAHGIYANRHWDGRFSTRWSPTSFFPLIAGVVPPDRAERMVREHLLNEREFWGRYVIPAIARSDPAYPDNDYWRGRIWGPFNFLVAEGLRRYRMDDVAAELSRRGLEMFMDNWRADGGIYENYNADNGKGADVWNAARLYHWGGLMAYVAIGELIDVEAAGYLRFGSLKFPNASVERARAGGAVYRVEMADFLRVWRDGKLFIEGSNRAIVRLPLPGNNSPVSIAASGPGRLFVGDPGLASRTAVINQGAAIAPRPAATGVEYVWTSV